MSEKYITTSTVKGVHLMMVKGYAYFRATGYHMGHRFTLYQGTSKAKAEKARKEWDRAIRPTLTKTPACLKALRKQFPLGLSK